ncbi:tetratricopeptide repeat-containing glycosyltransferase family 2 protein [Paenibacillus guangzhouensis]|uniref:tetratricopeptide repeat-containing glycosyltransferase family 2 protein n=1 Tax=Paenibacillus guangzhouensis TaxID=1473112 RepID=UPI00187B17D6|nr:glycosyltransferase [Paenibacillus guangzhouensis]
MAQPTNNALTTGNSTISLCMIVKNEAASLPACLESASRSVDEIIIVDTGSTDETVLIAEQFGAIVIQHAWHDDFADARNVALMHATGSWILFLDADERLDEDSHALLRNYAQHHLPEGFFLHVWNHSSNNPADDSIVRNPIIRMFRNRPEHRFSGRIHEQITTSITQHNPDAVFQMTEVIIHHYGYLKEQVVGKNKVQRNSSLLTEALAEDPQNPFLKFNLAVEHMRSGAFHPALDLLQQARSQLNDLTSYYHLVLKYIILCRIQLQSWSEAIAVCDEGITQYPDYTDLREQKATCLRLTGRPEQAVQVLLEALTLGPPPVHFHSESGTGTYLTCYALGQCYEDLYNDIQAIHWFTQALERHPSWILPLQRVVRLFKCAKEPTGLAKYIVQLQECFPAVDVQPIRDLLASEGCYEALRTPSLHNIRPYPPASEILSMIEQYSCGNRTAAFQQLNVFRRSEEPSTSSAVAVVLLQWADARLAELQADSPNDRLLRSTRLSLPFLPLGGWS